MNLKKFSNSILDYFTTSGIKKHYLEEENFSREFNLEGSSLNLDIERIEKNRRFYTTSKNFSNILSSGFLFSTIYFEEPWLLAPMAIVEIYRGFTHLIDLTDREDFCKEKKQIEWNWKADNLPKIKGERGITSLEIFIREHFKD
tara:strand:- start:243 stop:674 length:432 start_codon:yes stop_codon:yes gene_type:complete